MILSVNSCRDYIKAKEKKIDCMFNFLFKQLVEVINENKLLKVKFDQLETKLLDIERG